MAESSENPLIRVEKNNLKFGALTAALGLAAVFGSMAIPNHNLQLERLQVSLDAAGVIVSIKGAIQMLEALDHSNGSNSNT